MSDATGVAGQIHTLGEIPNASQTGLKNRKLIFAQLRCLVDGDDVVFLTLIAKGVPVRCAIAKGDAASVREGEALFAFPIGQERRKFGEQREDVVALKLCVGAANEQASDAGIGEAKTDQLSPKRPGFSAAARPSVGGIASAGSEELLLPFIGAARDTEDPFGVALCGGTHFPSSRMSCSKTRRSCSHSAVTPSASCFSPYPKRRLR